MLLNWIKTLQIKKKLEEIILINVPSDVYDELRDIFSGYFIRSGFKEIKIDKKIDFKKLYEKKKNSIEKVFFNLFFNKSFVH